MSKYTTQLRWIVEQLSEGLDPPEGQEYPSNVYQAIGLNRYPIFDEGYRAGLNDKIINHFYFQEIGFETPAQFAFMMRRTMNEIMPKYNALYQAQADMDAYPLADYWRKVDETKTEDKDTTTTYNTLNSEQHDKTETATISDTVDKSYSGTTTESYTNYHETQTDTRKNVRTHGRGVTENDSYTDGSRNIFSDTPMSMLNNQAQLPNVRDLSYATNVTYDDSDHSGSSTSQESGTTQDQKSGTLDITKTGSKSVSDSHETEDVKTGNETRRDAGSSSDAKTGTVRDAGGVDGERHLDEYGRNKTQAWLLNEFMEKYVNIDMKVISELETLFMGVW